MDINGLHKIFEIVPAGIMHIAKEYDIKKLCEIRFRINRKTVFVFENETVITQHVSSKDDIIRCIQRACGASIYAFTDEIKNGFITVEGGHRIGICGRTALKNGAVSNIVDFNGVNIRIAKEVRGCAAKLAPLARKNGMLIISPPGCGKTTMLRDIARIIGKSEPVSIVDERGEIAACLRGVPQFDIGEMTDVLDLCPKKEGIEIVLRAMSPKFIITDEIAASDIESVSAGILCGVKFVVSAHGDSISETLKRLDIYRADEKFGSVVLLGEKGTIVDILANNCERTAV